VVPTRTVDLGRTAERTLRRALPRVATATGAAALICLLSSGAAAAPFDPSATDWEGCSKLVEIARDELGASRVVVTDEIDYERLGAHDGLLVLHPEGAYDLDELSAFMRAGGRVALVDDFGEGDRLLDRFRISRGPSPADPLHMLRGNPQLPIATPSSGHPIVADVAQVVLNHPTTVRHPDLSSLLRIARVGGDAGPDVALAGQVGEGRLVAVGDPSVFINSMLRFPGNRALARNLVAYLLDGATERRREARLIVVHGRFREKGTMGGGVRGTIRDRFRGLLGAVENVRRGGFAGGAARVVALGIAIAAAIWVAVRAATRTKIPRPKYAAADPAAAAIGRAADDPRLAALFARAGLLRPRARPSPAGIQVLLEAVDAAIAARPELVAMPRERAIEAVGSQAALSPADRRTFSASYARLRGVAAGLEGSGPRAWKASRREIEILGRVLSSLGEPSIDEPGSPGGIPGSLGPSR
jgi:hypothetical protein